MENLRLPVEWAVAERPFPGEPWSGDAYVVRPAPGGGLIAVIDGVGHGPEAARAARVAAALLEASAGEPVDELVRRCHEELRTTRGAVMSVASVGARSLTWLGVGNVEGVLVRIGPPPTREALLLRGGTVGYRLPPLRPETLATAPGDLLVLGTDGLKTRFIAEPKPGEAPGAVVRRILSVHGRPDDDALVLAARWRADQAASGSST
jgi:negative regulator of sigma-B (phosphoserine phosphatase)